jgi:asparagine synthase (glutamine-hydrolysing)
MCGISVVLDRRGSLSLADCLRRMHEPIGSRGPDGEGFLLADDEGGCTRADCAEATPRGGAILGLAFRRLKIQDLGEAASQPMSNADGSLWLVFNGEIYNFRELRRELEGLGRRFRSSGDSEVALAAFEQWGESSFERLEGMWAIVVADLRRRRLVVSRDRFGIKPLHWANDGARFYLASEVKQILRGRGERPRAWAPLVAMFLRGQRLPCLEETFFEGVRPVPPATWFEVPFAVPDGFHPRFARYWDLGAQPGPEVPGYEEAVERVRELLRETVASHEVADVRTGCLLSGGLDSSTLAALAAELPEEHGTRPTFSFGFRAAAPEFCELPYVDLLVRQLGLPNHETTLDAAWIGTHAGRVIRALDEPPLALAPFGQYRVFGKAREHGVTVVLDGQGADEVFGGYPRYHRDLLIDRARHGRIAELKRELRAQAVVQGVGTARILYDFFGRPALRRLGGRAPSHEWIAPGYGRRASNADLRQAHADLASRASRVDRSLEFDVRWGNVKIVLGYSDRMAMAHSVEARVPYLDRRVVELAFSLPDSYKVGQGQRKRVLRDAARAVLPPAITERRDRIGFGFPYEKLLLELPGLRDVLLDPRFLASPCLDGNGTRRLVEAFLARRGGNAFSVWRLFALATWQREFDVDWG